MKRVFFSVVLIVVVLGVVSCKKDPEPIRTSVIITYENLTIGLTNVMFEVMYDYPTELKEINLYISDKNSMEDATDHKMLLQENQFSILINNLHTNTTYYYLYEFNSGSTLMRSEARPFTTKDYGLPTVYTNPVLIISNNDAFCGGRVTDDGDDVVSVRGVCWSTNNNPTIDDHKTVDGSGMGSLSSHLTGLDFIITYYVRAYATNSKGTAYGDEVSFTTKIYIGDAYQGGIVGYVDETGLHGFIAAPNDQNSATWFEALQICNTLFLNGYGDWFLPDKDELHLLYVSKNLIGGFANVPYWSSTELSSDSALGIHFGTGGLGVIPKSNTCCVRAVRRF